MKGEAFLNPSFQIISLPVKLAQTLRGIHNSENSGKLKGLPGRRAVVLPKSAAAIPSEKASGYL